MWMHFFKMATTSVWAGFLLKKLYDPLPLASMRIFFWTHLESILTNGIGTLVGGFGMDEAEQIFCGSQAVGQFGDRKLPLTQ